MRRFVLILAVVSGMLVLSGCFTLEITTEDISTPSGQATYITVGYGFDATRASASGSWDSYVNVTIGTSDVGSNELQYDPETRTYSVSEPLHGESALFVTVQLDESAEKVLYVYAYRLWNGKTESIEAWNIPKRDNPNKDEGMSLYYGDTVVYRLLKGEACAPVTSLTSIDELAIPEPSWLTSFGCGHTSYLEVAIRY